MVFVIAHMTGIEKHARHIKFKCITYNISNCFIVQK